MGEGGKAWFKYVWLALVFAGLAVPEAWADQGANSGARTNTVSSARLMAMGSAGTALDDDIGTLYQNPAGLAGMPLFQGQFTSQSGPQDIAVQQALVGANFPGVASFAMGYNYLDAGEQFGGLKATGQDLVAAAARKFGPVSLGLAAKGLKEKFDTTELSTSTIDTGVDIHAFKNFGLGVSVQNWFGELGGIPLQKLVRVGGSYGLKFKFHHALVVTADYALSTDDPGQWTFGTGVEYSFWKFAYVRAGLIKDGQGNGGFSDIAGPIDQPLHWGVGIKGFGFRLDYSYQSHLLAGVTQLLTVSAEYPPAFLDWKPGKDGFVDPEPSASPNPAPAGKVLRGK